MMEIPTRSCWRILPTALLAMIYASGCQFLNPSGTPQGATIAIQGPANDTVQFNGVQNGPNTLPSCACVNCATIGSTVLPLNNKFELSPLIPGGPDPVHGWPTSRGCMSVAERDSPDMQCSTNKWCGGADHRIGL